MCVDCKLFRNRGKASLPSSFRTYTPVYYKILANTRPVPFFTMPSAFSAVISYLPLNASAQWLCVPVNSPARRPAPDTSASATADSFSASVKSYHMDYTLARETGGGQGINQREIFVIVVIPELAISRPKRKQFMQDLSDYLGVEC